MKLLRNSLVVIATVGISACSYLGGGKTSTASSNKAVQIEEAQSVYTQGIGEPNSLRELEQASIENSDTESTASAQAETFHFAFDSSRIPNNDKSHILAQAKYLHAHPNARILLAGNTDERGSREYNVALGERRAKSVYDVLVFEGGVDRKQIRMVSYGEEKPVNLSHNEKAWSANRRVELTYEMAG